MKIITVPKHKKAQELLDLNECPSEMLEEIQLSSVEFDKLWDACFFVKINRASGSMIDDYEDDLIHDPDMIEAALKCIENCDWPEEISVLTEKIRDLFVKAMQYKTSVHFYF